MNYKNLYLTALLLQLITVNNFAGDSILSGQKPALKLHRYTLHTASQKLYLHFNKNQYSAGEIMWFKAYLLNSVNHLPDTARTNIYIDLISSGGALMEKRILVADNGIAQGDIILPQALPDGNYLLRAYTDWMKNFGEEYYFSRNFYIKNDNYEDMIPRSEVRSNRRFNRNLARMAENYHIAFFPEGGDLVQGVTNRIAYKAVDAVGRGLDSEGVILDEEGNEIATFTTLHDGMGSFLLTPEPGISYRARVTFGESRPQYFDLPPSKPDGIALRLERKNENILLEFSSGLTFEDHYFTEEIVLVAHSRGQVKYFENVILKEGFANTVISKEIFPSGIAHITVFSGDLVPLAERLVFINRNDGFIITPRIINAEYEEQEFLELQMEVTDNRGNAVEAQFSMSVIAGDFDPPGCSGNILSNVLLTSDLEGIIENPQYYLDPGKELDSQLDHVMMTHGWRRFDWESVLAGKLPEIKHKPSSYLTIRGKITDQTKDQPVSNHEVRLRVLSGYDDVYTFRSDGRGIFVFDELDYADNFRIELSSRGLAGNYPPNIELVTYDAQGYDYTHDIYTQEKQVTRRGANWKRVPGAGKSPYAESTVRDGPSTRQFGVPDQTIYIDRDKVTHRTVYDVLVERAGRLLVFGSNQVQFRDPADLKFLISDDLSERRSHFITGPAPTRRKASSEPMFILDGLKSSRDLVLSQKPSNIERIELFGKTSGSIFGASGADGVISLYTAKPGDPGFHYSKEFIIVGYHYPREFYSDIINPSVGSRIDATDVRVVHWEPNIFTENERNEIISFPFFEDVDKIKIIVEGVGNKGGIGFAEFIKEISR